MKSPEILGRDDLVEFAIFLYGNDWRDHLSEKLGISRRDLVVLLAGDTAIPDEISLSVLTLTEERLADLQDQQHRMKQRVVRTREALTAQSSRTTQPKGLSDDTV